MNNQARVTEWAGKVFTEAELCDIPERALRVLEEAGELAQACGVTVEQAHKLIDYVFSRDTGMPDNEVAGTMVTLYALCAVMGIMAQGTFEREIKRINTTEVIERVRRRQKEKREAVSERPLHAGEKFEAGKMYQCVCGMSPTHAGNCSAGGYRG